MSSIAENNKRIAKNTLMLYIRMLFNLLVSLYTSRLILQILGVENYGIYNVVGSVISMFAIFNGGINSAVQRYLTFEIGKCNLSKLTKVFSISLQVYVLISIIIIILGETVGLWFLHEKLVIPSECMNSAIWVYQCSIVACIINLMTAPYRADIVAHEKMSAFVYIAILEVLTKLIIVYLLYVIPWDKLTTYAILLLCTQLFISLIYVLYCFKHFEESHYHHHIDKLLFKEIFSFASWSIWGNLAWMLYTQGLNMMLNIFFGPVVNAARGIAVQVQNTVLHFTNNFQTAINPQITKNYATGNFLQMHNLIYRSARFSFYLLFFLTLPILVETNFLLTTWLKTVPNDSIIFTRWMIGISLISTISNPLLIANQATGKIKKYQAAVGGILLTILPISYISLKLGMPAYSVFIIHFCIECIAQFASIYILSKLIYISIKDCIHNIYKPIIIVIGISCLLPIYVHYHLSTGLMRFLIVGSVSVLSVGIAILIFGLKKEEQNFIYNKALKVLKIINTN